MEEIEEKWNEIFIQFLDQLTSLFPESPANKIKLQFILHKTISNKKPIIIFIENIKEHGDKIMNEDEDYFFSNKIDFVEELELPKYYKLSSNVNRKTIWDYIKILYVLSDGYSHKLVNK